MPVVALIHPWEQEARQQQGKPGLAQHGAGFGDAGGSRGAGCKGQQPGWMVLVLPAGL